MALYFYSGEVDGMRVWKRSILLFVGIAVLLLSTLTVSAESDSTGDIWHYTYSEDNWTWEAHTGSRPNIDITDISYTITDSEATLIMTVDGSIVDSDKIVYYMVMSADEGSYMAWYANEEGAYMAYGGTSYAAGALEDPVTGSTFTATFDIDDPDATYAVYGYTIELKETGDESGESWQDYAPNLYAPWYTGDGDGNGDGDGDTGDGDTDGNGDEGGGIKVPGFEIIAVISALAIALIILRRRK